MLTDGVLGVILVLRMPDGSRLPLPQVYRRLGELLRAYRNKARLTQEQLAECVGHTRTSIANIEAGRQRIPLDLLFRLANALQVDTRELIPEATSALPPEIEKKVSRDFDEAERRALKRVIG
jgi:transcriptional regulator with XRE-family HTH domain